MAVSYRRETMAPAGSSPLCPRKLRPVLILVSFWDSVLTNVIRPSEWHLLAQLDRILSHT